MNNEKIKNLEKNFDLLKINMLKDSIILLEFEKEIYKELFIVSIIVVFLLVAYIIF